MRHGKYPFIAGFLVIPVVLYAVYVIWPYAQAFYLSFTDWHGISANLHFIGFANYTKLFHDPVFWKAVEHNIMLLLALPLITIAIALFLSFMLNVGGRSSGGKTRGVWGSKFYRVVFFLPQVLSLAIIAVLFQEILRPDNAGAINSIVHAAGATNIGFLTNPTIAMWTIIGVLVWQSVGFYVVLFSAGMSSIPADIYEAAEIDGATRVTLFFRVTLPLLFDTVQVAWVYLGIAAFDAFALVNILTVDNGGPDGATTVLANEIYRDAFVYSRFGYASAMGVVLFFLTLTFAVLTLRLSRRESIEY
ncbi:MAG TPA: sugar ABC transporter permease [Rugosimonospora sp.]|jgi:N-acetylglucosamine transport system permease protein